MELEEAQQYVGKTGKWVFRGGTNVGRLMAIVTIVPDATATPRLMWHGNPMTNGVPVADLISFTERKN